MSLKRGQRVASTVATYQRYADLRMTFHFHILRTPVVLLGHDSFSYLCSRNRGLSDLLTSFTVKDS
jgi:hypothetical protein